MVSDARGWQSGTVPVAGGYLAYHRTGGSGPALVLSHGLTDNGLCWSRFAAALADQFDIVMIDARGHGGSSRAHSGDAPGPAEDLAQAVEALGLTRSIMMGHSVGARAAAAFAAAYPSRVRMVILEDPPLLPSANCAEMGERRTRFRQHVTGLQSMSALELAAYGREQSPGWHADEFAAWVEGKQQVDPEGMPEFTTPWQQDFAHIAAPILLICGEEERGAMVTPALAAEAVALNANIRVECIGNAGHNIRRENFEDYLATACAFLRAHGGN